MDYKKTILTSILAGFSIGLGGMIFLSVDNKIVGSALFSIGLFLVLTMNFSLFTGKVCYVLEGKVKNNLINIVLIWCGNFIGSFILTFIIKNTRVYGGLYEKAVGLCQIKNQDSYLSLFMLGIICNIFIFIGVDEYKKNEHVLGKYVAIILSVMGFILVGSEHCVADMFYYNMAGNYSKDMFIRLLIITIGNAVGGIAANHFVKKC
ncbi:Formate/nitrite transporter FocA, FNT family [Pseudobutyrivibrio sp. 49]|uniref:formate/nitrite transporter family protein n=1 Tax=unclassified Pseudobutyrivibrio TaxID=2638619 RepID=UPI000888AD9B|nr:MULTISPECIES: formate/nitrite transporter family protein [unclassified Pseudobutyrivibrio]SDI11668.1 Formate/nitrite transporter FocA, FNT family [Pseudobutyrivibrio sp. 49]SFN66549.1 Formate/nitrite transporter FocA, FNT family [Pseudobutyrivibrio sp. UC1225]